MKEIKQKIEESRDEGREEKCVIGVSDFLRQNVSELDLEYKVAHAYTALTDAVES
jgi:hypothetical protein